MIRWVVQDMETLESSYLPSDIIEWDDAIAYIHDNRHILDKDKKDVRLIKETWERVSSVPVIITTG